MKDTPQSFKEYFSLLVSFSSLALECSIRDLRKIFPDRQMILFDNDLTKKHIEIRLECATLSCTLGKDDKTNRSFLFLDNDDDLKLAIEYLNDFYQHESTLKQWSFDNYCIELEEEDGDIFCFSFKKCEEYTYQSDEKMHGG